MKSIYKIFSLLILASFLLSACGPTYPSLWEINDPIKIPLKGEREGYYVYLEPITKEAMPNPREALEVRFYHVIEYQLNPTDPTLYLVVGEVGTFKLLNNMVVLRERYFRVLQNIFTPGKINPIDYDIQPVMLALCEQTKRETGALAFCESITMNLSIQPHP